MPENPLDHVGLVALEEGESQVDILHIGRHNGYFFNLGLVGVDLW